MLLQSALALFMPPGQVPIYTSITPAAAASDGAPSLPTFIDSRELQLVAAAFAAGAAAGVAGQMQHGSLDPFGSGDASNSGFALESAAPAAADGVAESVPAEALAAGTAQAARGRQLKAARSRSINSSGSAGASHKSTYRGVFWDRKNNRWRAQVGHNNRKIFMGYFSEPTEAARAYDKKLVQLRGTMGEPGVRAAVIGPRVWASWPAGFCAELHTTHRAQCTTHPAQLPALPAHLWSVLMCSLVNALLFCHAPPLLLPHTAKTNFPLQEYADDLKLHKELRARENGDELLLLPLEELQAHLQQHMQELLPKQPALQKVYSDWSRHKAQSGGVYEDWGEGQQSPLADTQMRMGSVGQLDWLCEAAEADAAAAAGSGERMPASQKDSLTAAAAANVLEQQCSSSLPGQQQQQEAAQHQQAKQHADAMDVDTPAAALRPAPRSNSSSPAKPASSVPPQASPVHPQQPQNISRHSSPTRGALEGGSRATGSGGAPPSRAASNSGASAHRQLREPPKTLQQHLLTRLHEQRVHRSSSNSSMDALLAAAAVLEEEEEVAATLHELVSLTSAPAAEAQAATGHAAAAAGEGSPPALVHAAGAAAAGAHSPLRLTGRTGAAAAALAPAECSFQQEAQPAAGAKAGKAARAHKSKQRGVVVTDVAAVVAAILSFQGSQPQPGTAAALQQQQQGQQPVQDTAAEMQQHLDDSKQQLAEGETQSELSALAALRHQMLQPPTTQQQVLQSMQLADRAGVHKERQQLLLLVMYRQALDLLKQQGSQESSSQQQQQQDPEDQQLEQLLRAQLASVLHARSSQPETTPPAAAAAAAAANEQPAAHKLQQPQQEMERSASLKRRQGAQEAERPEKQLCQGLGSAQPEPAGGMLLAASVGS